MSSDNIFVYRFPLNISKSPRNRLGSSTGENSLNFFAPVLHLDSNMLEFGHVGHVESALLLLDNELVSQHSNSNGLKTQSLKSDTEIPFTCVVRKKVFGVPSLTDFEQKEVEEE
jgi:hypothetical protein